jgi:hypothetical protein
MKNLFNYFDFAVNMEKLCVMRWVGGTGGEGLWGAGQWK